MGEEKVSRRGMPYVTATLKTKARTVTEAALWKIRHRSGDEEISLKLGRYSLEAGKHPETMQPKSELTLEPDELAALLKMLEENLEPFRAGAKKWLTLGDDVAPSQIEQLRALFASPDQRKLVAFLEEHDIVSADLVRSLEFNKRCRAVAALEAMLDRDLTEQPWQKWFEDNEWVLGSEFVRLLDERPIDVSHIADYLMQAYDGFLDLVEIKRPEGALRFWAEARDRGNYVPHSDLVKAITQANRYVLEVEREANSVKFLERLGGVRAIKPRCILIFGRSEDWNDEQREAYRILNAGYHNLTILTFDHVLRRAKRMLGLQEASDAEAEESATDDLPF
jgi:Shedu protein SduA, C-terminal